MIDDYLYTALATARRNDVIAEAQASRLARMARTHRRHRTKARIRREPKYRVRGATRLTRVTGRAASVAQEVAS